MCTAIRDILHRVNGKTSRCQTEKVSITFWGKNSVDLSSCWDKKEVLFVCLSLCITPGGKHSILSCVNVQSYLHLKQKIQKQMLHTWCIGAKAFPVMQCCSAPTKEVKSRSISTGISLECGHNWCFFCLFTGDFSYLCQLSLVCSQNQESQGNTWC